MGNILVENIRGCRLVEDEGDYYIVDPGWNELTDHFDGVVTHGEDYVIFERDGREYEVLCQFGRWVQKCRTKEDEELYCGEVTCERHPYYMEQFVCGDLPALVESDYEEWEPSLFKRIDARVRSMFAGD